MDETTPAEAATAAPRRRTAWFVVGALAVLGAGVGIGVALSGNTPAAPSSAAAATAGASSSATTLLSGTVIIYVPTFTDTTIGSATAVNGMHEGDECTGVGTHAGVEEGLTVAVTGPAGQALGELPLENGLVGNYPASGGIAACQFQFAGQVPADAGTYTVTVGSFGSKTATVSELSSVDVVLQ